MIRNPAFWAAVAAACSAVSAFLTWRVHWRNRLDAARPEFVITEVSRAPTDTDTVEAIHIHAVKNVGRGPAFDVIINFYLDPEVKENAVMMSTVRLPILSDGEQRELADPIMAFWDKVPKPTGHHPRMIFGVLRVSCSDYRGYRHVTEYVVTITEPGAEGASIADVASGISMPFRFTKSRAQWRIKARRKLTRIKGLRRWAEQDEAHIVAPWTRKFIRTPSNPCASDYEREGEP
jgi:hypothetical protein